MSIDSPDTEDREPRGFFSGRPAALLWVWLTGVAVVISLGALLGARWVFLALVFTVVLATAVWRRQLLGREAVASFATWLLVLFAAVLLVRSVTQFGLAFDRGDWVETEGVIVLNEPFADGVGDYLHVEYLDFAVEDPPGQRADPTRLGRFREDLAVGDRLDVFYDPAAPSRASLRSPETEWEALGLWVVASVPLALIAAIVVLRRNGGYRSLLSRLRATTTLAENPFRIGLVSMVAVGLIVTLILQLVGAESRPQLIWDLIAVLTSTVPVWIAAGAAMVAKEQRTMTALRVLGGGFTGFLFLGFGAGI